MKVKEFITISGTFELIINTCKNRIKNADYNDINDLSIRIEEVYTLMFNLENYLKGKVMLHESKIYKKDKN